MAILKNGSSSQIVSAAEVSTPDKTETLTNKTLTIPAIAGGNLSNAIIVSPEERTNISATEATGTINIDCLTSTLIHFTADATGNFTLNFRGNSETSLADTLETGDSITIAFLVTNGQTPRHAIAFEIDGASVTPKFSGGTAPAAGNASAIDAYSFTIIKTAASPTYIVIGAGPIKYS